jgi:hypothetical protein
MQFHVPLSEKCCEAQDRLQTQLASAALTAERAKEYVHDAAKLTYDLAAKCEIKLRSQTRKLADAKARELE